MSGDPADETFTVSDAMWDAMEVVSRRNDGHAHTYISRTPQGDAAISLRTAKALVNRGFIVCDLTGQRCWPTPGGLAAYQSHLRRSTP